MQRAIFNTVLLCFVSSALFAQVKKHYQIEDTGEYSEVHFSLKASSGSCQISPTNNPNPVSVYGMVIDDKVEPRFRTQNIGPVNHVTLSVNDNAQESLLSGINFFGSGEEQPENRWKVFLAQGKPFNLSLEYGTGDAMVDLSGIAVKKLNISTASADVRIGYHKGFFNKVEMDTFNVKVDLGNITVDHMEQARARNVIADVGFGNCTLDFGEEIKEASNVTAYVGAGNLIVMIPNAPVPLKIVIQNSPLCHVQLTDSFVKVAEDTWVNEYYDETAPNITTFTLDVAMGQILFKEK